MSGPKLRQHCLIDDSVLRQLEAAIAAAPLHTPSALSVIRFAQEHFPGLPQVASFDTTFHADLPEVARVLPISRALQLEGIQRNGFHGLSCESIVRQLAKGLPNRLVIAHLGNGASVTTVKGGKSIDTSGIDANRRGDHGHAVSIRRVPGRRWLNVNPPARQVILAAIGRRWRRESKPLVGSRLLDSLRKAFEG